MTYFVTIVTSTSGGGDPGRRCFLGGRKSGEVETEKYETSRGAKSFSNSVV